MNDPLDNVTIPNLPAGIYQHSKSGNKYEVIGIALHEETLDPMVIYKPLYASKVPFWARPYNAFVENIIIDGKSIPRFVPVLDE